MSDEGINCPVCGSDDISFTFSMDLTGDGEGSGLGIEKLTCDACGHEMPFDGLSGIALANALLSSVADEDEEESVDPDWQPIQVSGGPVVAERPDDVLEISSGAGLDIASDVLLEFASPQIYRRNAFRITELPVDATTRDIGKELDRLRMMEKLGSAGNRGSGPLALDPPPDGDAMREAMQRLHDPEQRMVDELFWFWPMVLGEGRADEGIALLSKGDVPGAASLWMARERAGSEANVSVHNLAVLAHATALDLELTDKGEASDPEERDRWWREALKRWRLVLDDQGFWSRVTVRIREMDDPRLTTGTARRMQASLPLTLLMINARLALSAAESGEWGDARRHVGILHGSGFGEEVVHEALKRALEPLRGRVQMLAKTAEDEGDAEPERSKECANRLLKQAEPLLEIVDCLLEEGDPMRTAIHDEVALRLLGCEITYGNTTEDWKGAEGILKPTLKIAEGEAARTRIDQNLDVVKSNKELQKTWGVCWFCGKNKPKDDASLDVQMFGDVTRTPTYGGTQITWQKGEIGVPRCEDCEEAHLTNFLWYLWYPFVLLLALLAAPIALFRFVPRFRKYPTARMGALLGFSAVMLISFVLPFLSTMWWMSGAVGPADARRAPSSIAALHNRILESPENDEHWGDLGDAYSREGNGEWADASYAVALILDPHDTEWSSKDQAWHRVPDIIRVLGITDASFVGRLGHRAELEGFDVATSLYALADSLDPGSVWQSWLAMAQADPGTPATELAHRERTVALNQMNDELWGDLGDLYATYGYSDAAESCYAVARLLDTNDSEWRGHSPRLETAAGAIRSRGFRDAELTSRLLASATSLRHRTAVDALDALSVELAESREGATSEVSDATESQVAASSEEPWWLPPAAVAAFLLPTLFGLLGAAVGFHYGKRARARSSRPERVRETKPESAKLEFPPIKERLKKGWELGEKPSEAYGG